MTIKNAVDTTLAGQTGTGAFVGATSPTLITPILGAATCSSLLVNDYSLPPAQGTVGQVVSMVSPGVTAFQDSSTGTITGATNLGGGTDTFAGVAGTDLTFNTYTAGTNINFSTAGNLTTISASGSGMTFPYMQAYWVAQVGGSDSALGTSIETPFLTVQHAITVSALIPTVIYVVDGFANTEPLTTSGGGQQLYISAPGTYFNAGITVNSGDTVTVDCLSITTPVNQGTTYLHCTNVFSATNGGNSLYITADTATGVTCSGGFSYLNINNLSTLALTTGAIAYLDTQEYSGITNDGTAILNGTTNGTNPGGVGNFQITEQFIGDSISFSDTTHGVVGTISADDAAAGYVGQFLSATGSLNIPNNGTRDIATLSLTAGDWDLTGSMYFTNNGSGSGTTFQGWISTTSATIPSPMYLLSQLTDATLTSSAFTVPQLRVNVSTTTTVYLSGHVLFGSGTLTASGQIMARRVR